MEIINETRKRKITYENIVFLLLLAIFFYSFMMQCYVNLFQLQYHMGFDSTTNYLQAFEMWKQKSLVLNDWEYQNTLGWDTPIPLAAFIYTFVQDIFVSYGLANIIINVIVLITLYSIAKDIGFGKISILIIENMYLCPYIGAEYNNANDLGWFSSLITSGAWWNVRILTILLVFKSLIKLRKQEKCKILLTITTILCIFTAISSGYYVLVTVILPAVVMLIYELFLKNDWNILKSKATVFLVCEVCCIVLAKILTFHFLGYESKDSSMVLTGLDMFWSNIGSIILGFINLVSGMKNRSDMSALSANGLMYLVGLVILLACVISFVYFVFVKRKISDIEGEYPLVLASTIIVVNLAMYIVLFTTYGGGIFEIRYLCSIYIMLMLFVANYLERLEDNLLWKKAGYLIVTGCIGLKVLSGYHYFNNTLVQYDTLEKVVDTINSVGDSSEIPVVYVFGDDIGVADGRKLRVADTSRVYKSVTDSMGIYHWGDYTTYDELGEWTGANVLLCTDEKYSILPENLKKNYVLREKVDKYNIYYAKKNVLDFNANWIGNKYYIDDFANENYILQNGKNVNDGSLVSTGEEGYVFYGNQHKAEAGVYDITLNYHLLESQEQCAGYFEIVADNGATIIAQGELEKNANQVELKNVVLEQGEEYECRCFNKKGTVVEIMSISANYRKSSEE